LDPTPEWVEQHRSSQRRDVTIIDDCLALLIGLADGGGSATSHASYQILDAVGAILNRNSRVIHFTSPDDALKPLK
jgi:hypothetical protein